MRKVHTAWREAHRWLTGRSRQNKAMQPSRSKLGESRNQTTNQNQDTSSDQILLSIDKREKKSDEEVGNTSYTRKVDKVTVFYQDSLSSVGHVDAGSAHFVSRPQRGDDKLVALPRRRRRHRILPLEKRAWLCHGWRHLMGYSKIVRRREEVYSQLRRLLGFWSSRAAEWSGRSSSARIDWIWKLRVGCASSIRYPIGGTIAVSDPCSQKIFCLIHIWVIRNQIQERFIFSLYILYIYI